MISPFCRYRILLLIVVMLLPAFLFAQTRLVVGVVTDTMSNPLPNVNVMVEGTNNGTSTDENGRFKLNVVIKNQVIVRLSFLGYQTDWVVISPKDGAGVIDLRFALKPESKSIDEVFVSAIQRRQGNIDRLSARGIEFMPNISGNFESLLKSIPGVSSSNELSSQYTVRGGNFDENLVYVNDIEIFRPFLVRSGQQEGLSFINPDMVAAVEFSAGAFNAEFGDKMSSVLNVRYRNPIDFRTTVSASLLGASATTEGVLCKSRFTYITGVRYKTSQYMLSTLDVKGDYSPTFIDWQGLFNYQLTPKLSVSLLGNYSGNTYMFAPDVRETRFGLFSSSLQLKVYYEGQERDRFQTGMGALAFEYKPTPALSLKLYSANYFNSERETYDILGQYYLNELDNSMGSSTYGDSLINVGIGGFLNHARNYLDAYVNSIGHIGVYRFGDSRVKWGFSLQRDHFDDELVEWDLIDSSGYSLPYTGNSVGLAYSLRANNTIDIHRAAAFLQADLRKSIGPFNVQATLGCRALYWDLNDEFLLSPRATMSVVPKSNKNLEFHFSTGIYYQPPFYKELRMASGAINHGIKSQKSVQYLLGGQYYFSAWSRPFRLSAELYYKSLSNLIPYKLDNVRVRYSGGNLAKGYARGFDVKVNGELVPGAESWVGFSLLRTMEDRPNDSYGSYPRPTDQRFAFNLYFQDYLPGNPSFRVHLYGFYGSGLPFGKASSDRYDINFRMSAYRRVDLGFTKILLDDNIRSSILPKRLTAIKSVWVSAEVFNLFNFNNTVSYMWVQTVGNQDGYADSYAVPNYLTSRRINVKLMVKF
ncbi:MAG: carboxypeptidase-like regulatory domain-containing protein [Bacteroidales bacterium]|nr:carboxypeptidase-like regulatory domain-containing protein [Bacteroidales bacterium]